MGNGTDGRRFPHEPDEPAEQHVAVGKRCVVVQGGEVRHTWFTGRAWGGWRVAVDLLDGPAEVRVGALDGARILRGYAVADVVGSVLQDLRVVAHRQDRAEVRVARLGRFWLAAPGASHWVPTRVRDLSAIAAALVVPEPLPKARLRGSVRTEIGHSVEFETLATLVRRDDSNAEEVVAVYELGLEEPQRCALRAAVLWETTAKRGLTG